MGGQDTWGQSPEASSGQHDMDGRARSVIGFSGDCARRKGPHVAFLFLIHQWHFLFKLYIAPLRGIIDPVIWWVSFMAVCLEKIP